MKTLKSQVVGQKARNGTFKVSKYTSTISTGVAKRSTDEDDTYTPMSKTSITSTFTQITKRRTRADSAGQAARKRYYTEYTEDIDEIDETDETDTSSPDDKDEHGNVDYGSVRLREKQPKVQRTTVREAVGINDEDMELDAYILKFKLNKLKRKHAPPPAHLVTNRKKFAFDHNPFWHYGYEGPSPTDVENVMTILSKYHKAKDDVEFPENPDGTLSGASAKLERPGHAAIGITIDNIVKVIFSQSTNNLIATRLHDRLCDIFRYDVDGQSYVGTVPNYHKMLVCTREEILEALRTGGLYESRSDTIISITNNIYAANCARLGLDKDMPSYNEPGAKDFVPGLLSMDYLNGMEKTELMDHLLSMTGIGVKSAACILAFNFGIPVFAVDTHVQSMVRQLGWVPENCTDEAISCMALDRVIPNVYKYSLHQAFWHHRIKCGRCKGHASEEPCPLEHLCNREIEKRGRRSLKKEEVIGDPTMPKSKKVKTEKQKAFSVGFHKMTPEKAIDQGYVLVRESVDNDFGVSTIKQNYVSWFLKEKAPSTRVTTVEEAEQNGWIPAKPMKKEAGQSSITSFVVKAETKGDTKGSVSVKMEIKIDTE